MKSYVPPIVCLAFMLCHVACISAAPKLIELSNENRATCLQVLRDGLKSDEFGPSIHAAEGLTLGGKGNEVIASFKPKLADEVDDQRRCLLARELVRAGQQQYKQVLLDILASDDPQGHVHAAESLYKVSEVGDGVALRRAFSDSSNPRLQIMAAAALGKCGNPEAMDFLRNQLKTAEPEIARIAGWVLGRIGSAEDIPALQRRRDQSDTVLQRVFHENSLAALGDKNGTSSLMSNLSSADSAVRTYCATFAGDARAIQTKPQLLSLLSDPVLDVRIRAAQSLLILTAKPPHDRNEELASVPFAATQDNPRYTEGSILELLDGSLLFAVTEFFGSGSDFDKAHIVARHSDDGGQTWGPKRILQNISVGMNCMSATLRRISTPDDPNRIALFYLHKNSHSDLDLFVRYSADEAKSFGPPILITDTPGYHVVNNDRIAQLSDGRLLAPAASTPDVSTVNHFTCRCFISDDNGFTWRAGKAAVDLPKRGAMEPEVVELTDGRVLMIMRNQLGFISKSYSSDGGETWTKPDSLGIVAPEAPATLRRIPSTGDLLLIWNNNFEAGAGHGGERTPLNASISNDDGLTWDKMRILESNPNLTYSYVSLTFVRDRAVLSYWVADSSTRQWSTKFRSLPVSWFYK